MKTLISILVSFLPSVLLASTYSLTLNLQAEGEASLTRKNIPLPHSPFVSIDLPELSLRFQAKLEHGVIKDIQAFHRDRLIAKSGETCSPDIFQSLVSTAKPVVAVLNQKVTKRPEFFPENIWDHFAQNGSVFVYSAEFALEADADPLLHF